MFQYQSFNIFKEIKVSIFITAKNWITDTLKQDLHSFGVIAKENAIFEGTYKFQNL